MVADTTQLFRAKGSELANFMGKCSPSWRTYPVCHDHTCRFLNLGIEPAPKHCAIASSELNVLTSEDHFC